MSAELSSESEFSVICSFFNKFGSFLGLKPQPFTRLESMLSFDEEGRVDKGLVDLHIQLLRRAGQKTATHKKFEHCLIKYLEWDPMVVEEFRTVERFGYAHAPLATKLAILRALCDRQFDWNPKFKEQVLACSARELRLLPVGQDSSGRAYWYQQDAALSLRIYSEEPDDVAGRTWALRANSRARLAALITFLETGEEVAEGAEGPKDADVATEEGEAVADVDGSKDTAGKDAEAGDCEGAKDEADTDDAALKGGEEAKPSEEPEAKDKGPSDDAKEKTTEPSQENAKAPDDDTAKEAPEAATSEPSTDAKAADEPTPSTSEAVKKETLDDEEEAKPATKAPPKAALAKMSRKGTTLDTFQEAKPPKHKQLAEVSGDGTPGGGSGEESRDHLPEELKPFIERRIMPRRATRSANTNFKDLADGKNTSTAKAEKAAPAEKEGDEEDEEAGGLEEEKDESSEEEEDREEGDSDSTSDDEFLPLSALKNGKGRRRRRRKVDFDDCDSDVSGGEEPAPKKSRKVPTTQSHCGGCGKSTAPEVLLLCDACDDAWHTWCLKPELWFVPDEDWFCPKCQHSFLLAKLKAALGALDEELARKDEERKKKEAESCKKKRQQERLARELDFIGISLNNIIGTRKETPDDDDDSASSNSEAENEAPRARKERRKASPPLPIAVARTKRARTRVDYTFNSYDEMVTEAVEELLEGKEEKTEYHDPARPTGGLGRGKDMANIIQADKEREGSEGSGDRKLPKKSRAKLTDLDDEPAEDDEDDDEYEEDEEEGEEGGGGEKAAGSESEFEPDDEEEDEEEFLPRKSRGGREGLRRSARICTQPTASDEDFVVSGSDSDEYRPTKKKKAPPKKAPKKKRRRRDDTSESEDSLLEGKRSDSEDGSDSDYGRKKAKSGGRTRGRRVDFKKLVESSEDDDDEEEKENGTDSKDVDPEAKPEKDTPPKAKGERPTGAYRRNKIESDGEDYKEDESEESDDDDEKKGSGGDGEEDDEEDEQEGSEKDDGKEPSPAAKEQTTPPSTSKPSPSPAAAPPQKEAAKARIITPAPKPESPSLVRVVAPIPQRASPLLHSASNSPLVYGAHPTPPLPPPQGFAPPGFFAPPPELAALKPAFAYRPPFAAPPFVAPAALEPNEEGSLTQSLSDAMRDDGGDFHQL